MGVKDVLAMGAQEPTKPEGPPDARKERPLVERYRAAVAEGVELRGLSEGLGGGLPGIARPSTPSEQRVEETGAKSAFSVLETLVKDMTQAARDAANEARTAEREAMAVRLEALSEKIEGLAGNDPISAFMQTKRLLDEYTGEAKGRMGLQPASNLDFTATATLEQMKIDHAETMARLDREEKERDRRWQTERDDLRRRWTIEDRQFESTHNLEVQKLNRESTRSDKNSAAISNLVGAFTENMGGATPAAPVASQLEPTRRLIPQSFMCHAEGCGTTVNVAPGSMDATCSKCQTEYDMTPRQEA